MGAKAHEPTKAEVQALRDLMQSMGYKPALAKMGIAVRSANRWRNRGKYDLERNQSNGFVDWYRAIEESNADKLSAAESLIHKANNPENFEDLPMRDRLANARWTAKVLDPSTYGDRTEVQLRGSLEALCESVREHMSAAAYAEFISALATVSGLDIGAGDGDEHDDDDSDPLS
tara:strand:+ start:1530 stop:2051 length:522 start_codon:yes stop_codon:yes gene_type:complete